MSYEFTAPPKDPSAVLDYGMDWSGWLDQGEVIVGTPAVNSEPADLLITQSSQLNGVVTWRASGGSHGQNYIVTVRISTSLGRVDERSIRYPVRQR